MKTEQAPSATVEEIVNKHLSKVVEFLQQIGTLEEITEESTDDDKMYDGDIRYHIYSAIENAIGEYRHSQQPTVEVDYEKMARDIINCIESEEGCGEEFNINKVAGVLLKYDTEGGK